MRGLLLPATRLELRSNKRLKHQTRMCFSSTSNQTCKCLNFPRAFRAPRRSQSHRGQRDTFVHVRDTAGTEQSLPAGLHRQQLPTQVLKKEGKTGRLGAQSTCTQPSLLPWGLLQPLGYASPTKTIHCENNTGDDSRENKIPYPDSKGKTPGAAPCQGTQTHLSWPWRIICPCTSPAGRLSSAPAWVWAQPSTGAAKSPTPETFLRSAR